jgi:hypothetical protein
MSYPDANSEAAAALSFKPMGSNLNAAPRDHHRPLHQLACITCRHAERHAASRSLKCAELNGTCYRLIDKNMRQIISLSMTFSQKWVPLLRVML